MIKFSRLLIFFLLFTIYYLLFTRTSFAQEEFNTVYDTTYTVSPGGSAQVTQKIILTNNFSKIYASSYTLTIEGKVVENVHAVQGNTQLPTEVSIQANQTKVIVSFPDAVVGKNKSREFAINYIAPGIATQNGKVWDITIPKLASPELINEYNLALRVPSSFGNPAYISPEPLIRDKTDNNYILKFKKDDLTHTGIVAAFGEFQVFSFDLAYHLQNKESKAQEQQIALPPDTAFQKVYYESLTPQPEEVMQDPDGNWLAKYKLAAGERLDINTRVTVQVFASPQKHYQKVNPRDRDYYLMPTSMWQVDDSSLQQIAQTLRTPRQIYDFVVGKLNYDYSRVRENTERFGAKKALENPNQAICTEFTDLFITLSRAAGIPAREINGYAYTQNPQLQPLSLVADVLHAWPEYWDEKEELWRPVDPTWEDTTGGINYFDKFDLSHITFAIHGASPAFPLPAGAYKTGSFGQKDLQGRFGQLPAALQSRVDIQILGGKTTFPFFPLHKVLKITNPGPVAIYNLPVGIGAEGSNILSESNQIDFLAPFASAQQPISFQVPFIPPSDEMKLKVIVNDVSAEYNLSKAGIYLPRLIIVFSLILILLVIALLPRLLPRVIEWKHKVWQ